jgi:hypothetical protein
MFIGVVHPTEHEKNEWSRMAKAAYAIMRNDVGHAYSCAASLPHNGAMRFDYFDKLQDAYRAWLAFGNLPNNGFDL